MASKYAPNRNKVASSPAAGVAVVNPHTWECEASTNGDKVYIGELPAFHKIHAEGCSFIAAGDTTAMNVDVVLEDEEGDVTLLDNQAVSADTFARAAFSTYQAIHEAGAKPVNRRVYLLLNTAPSASRGSVTVNLASYPVS